MAVIDKSLRELPDIDRYKDLFRHDVPSFVFVPNTPRNIPQLESSDGKAQKRDPAVFDGSHRE
jgi:hypothetical protein